MMLKQLRRKFILITMGFAAAMLLVIFGLIFYFTNATLENQSNSLLQLLSQGDKPYTGTLPGQDIRLPYFILQINGRGELIATGSSAFDLTDREFIEELLDAVNDAQESRGRIEKYQLIYQISGSPSGTRLVFLDISSQAKALSNLINVCAFVGIVSLAAFWGLSILLARWAVRPVEKTWNQQKQFVSDASHELKTPLTVIMSNAELLNNSSEGQSQYAQNILTMSHHMRSLVEGLLELARADNGQIRKNFQTVEFSRLVSEALLPFEPLCFEQGLQLQDRITSGICVNGSDQYLQQVIDILLDNAQKYTSSGIIHVQLIRQGRSQCVLSVSNPGQPIPQEELERIFERFYRTDSARSRSGSFGLGLSIARSIVTEHGGKIWAESNSTGNCFHVLLPCQPISISAQSQ